MNNTCLINKIYMKSLCCVYYSFQYFWPLFFNFRPLFAARFCGPQNRVVQGKTSGKRRNDALAAAALQNSRRAVGPRGDVVPGPSCPELRSFQDRRVRSSGHFALHALITRRVFTADDDLWTVEWASKNKKIQVYAYTGYITIETVVLGLSTQGLKQFCDDVWIYFCLTYGTRRVPIGEIVPIVTRVTDQGPDGK